VNRDLPARYRRTVALVENVLAPIVGLIGLAFALNT